MKNTNNIMLPTKRTLYAAIFLSSLISTASAGLSPRLGGKAVYDDDLDITWIANASLSESNTFGVHLVTDPIGGNPGTTWQSSQDWISGMNTAGYLGFRDWRLPICDASNCANSELGHLFTSEGISRRSPGLFSGIRNLYWTGTNVVSDPTNYAWVQLTGSNTGFDFFKTNTGAFPWAVRSGDVSSCSVSYDLPQNQWRQIGLPCDPGTNNKVSDIFTNMPGIYGTNWKVYRYDGKAYIDVGSTGTLQHGEGYWIIQTSAAKVALSMPQSSTPALTTECAASTRGCFEVPLSPANGSWSMIGFPLDTKATFDGVSIVTEDTYFPGYGTQYVPSPCAKDFLVHDGCSLREANGYEISSDSLWTYDGSQYIKITNGTDVLEPWRGYWVGILPRAGEFALKGIMLPKQKANTP